MQEPDPGASLDRDVPWLRRYARGLMGRALRRTHDSLDLVQSALARVLPSYRDREFDDSGERRRFLRRAVQNHALYRGRQARGVPVSGFEPDGLEGHEPAPDFDAILGEEHAEARARLARLGERARRIVLLRVQQDRPFAEIAEELGMREEAARQAFRRAMKRLAGSRGDG
jgi:RNA polymerase sigma factor (sigma-70 family)